MAQNIHKLLDKIDSGELRIIKASEKILPSIKLIDVIADPRGTLSAVAQKFVDAHKAEFDAAEKAGRAFAEVVANAD